MLVKTPLFPLLFLIGAIAFLAVRVAICKIRPVTLRDEFKKHPFYYSIYRFIEKYVSRGHESTLSDFLNLSSFITIVCYGVSASLYFVSHKYFPTFFSFTPGKDVQFDTAWLFLALVCILIVPLGAYFFVHTVSSRLEFASLKLFTWLASIGLVFLLPISWPLIWIEHKFLPFDRDLETKKKQNTSERIKHKLLELLEETEMKERIDAKDKKLIKSLANFQDRVAREIMVPKIDIIACPEDTCLADAAPTFIEEGFSRIPIYQESIDLITGVLLYKDVLAFLLENIHKDPEILKKTQAKDLAKGIIYAPEGKKIADLLQEMKQLQIHIAVLVNEYGCTEGIVTIEDILEEIVGEISDEHDVDEEQLYAPTKDNAWIVDARMNVIDLEKATGVSIPTDPEYETVGGFILYQLNSFPSVGAVIHHEKFDIKVLSTGKRQIYKVKISPVTESSSDLDTP